jgi:hypothetical protein
VWTYLRHGCRCDECKAANRAERRSTRTREGGASAADRVQRRAATLALKWIRSEHPEQWRAFLEQARIETGGDQ